MTFRARFLLPLWHCQLIKSFTCHRNKIHRIRSLGFFRRVHVHEWLGFLSVQIVCSWLWRLTATNRVSVFHAENEVRYLVGRTSEITFVLFSIRRWRQWYQDSLLLNSHQVVIGHAAVVVVKSVRVSIAMQQVMRITLSLFPLLVHGPLLMVEIIHWARGRSGMGSNTWGRLARCGRFVWLTGSRSSSIR